MSKDSPAFEISQLPDDVRVAIVAARFNEKYVDQLLLGCKERLSEAEIIGDRLQVHRVPGAFELPVAAKALAETKQFAAIICLGCVIRGDTPHFDYGLGATALVFALFLPRGLWGWAEARFGLRLLPVGYRVVAGRAPTVVPAVRNPQTR